jgi:Tol biopolymer transport system component
MTRLRWSVAGLALATFPCFTALAATPFVLDDYYLLAAVSEPAFSPGGDRIVYTVSRNDRKSDQSTSDLWSVPWSGGNPVQLTRTPKSSESQPRYARDGKSLFFLSDAGEDEVTQLWRASAKGSGARRVTNIPGGISDYDLSPDGKRAVVIADVGRHVGSKAEIAPPIETDRFLFKLDGEGYLDDRTRQLFIVDLGSGKATQLTSGERDHWHAVWSPDGASLAYTAKPTTMSSCSESARVRRKRSAPRTDPITIRTGTRTPPGRRIRVACSGWKVVTASGSITRRRSLPWRTSPPEK